MRVLLVDDHPTVRGALIVLLRDEPDVDIVGEAGDGRAAVEQTQSLRPDVVVMDINMPVMNGIQATRAIHAEYPGIYVIGLSSSADGGGPMREAGAGEYVNKSALPDGLLEILRAYARERRAQALRDAA